MGLRLASLFFFFFLRVLAQRKISHTYSKPQEVFSFSKGWKHFHGHLLAVDGQCRGGGVDSAYLYSAYTLYYHLCAGLWVAPDLSPGCAKPMAINLSAASNSLGCESATCIMEGRELCILQVCINLIILCFIATSGAFIFAQFVKYFGNCLQLPSCMAFKCEN